MAIRRLRSVGRGSEPRVLEDGTRFIQTGEEVQWLVRFLDETKEVVTFDTETTGCDPRVEHPRYKARATSVQFSTSEFPRIYLDNYKEAEGNIQNLRRWATDPYKLKDGYNLKYDIHVLSNHGMRLRGVDCDTIVCDYLLDTSREGRHDLETACFDWGLTPQALPGYRETFSFFPLKKDGTPKKNPEVRPHTEWWDMGEWERVVKYATKDGQFSRLLRAHHEAAMRKIQWDRTRSYWDYYKLIDLPMLDVLVDMELEGVAVDSEHLNGLALEFEGEIASANREFLSRLLEAGVPQNFLETFNMGSSQQLGVVLYDILGYKCPKWTGRRPGEGSRSVDEVALNLLVTEQDCKVLEPLFKSREFGKLHSTYAVGLPHWASHYRGRVHSGFNQIGTATMRLSSSKPNLQNIPTRTKLGKRIREGFIAPEGCKMLVADYSQIELRVVAHKSQDATLVRYFHEGKDPHALTAYGLFPEVRADVDGRGWDVDTKEVQKWIKANYDELRGRAKTWNFMVVYGGGEQRAMDVFKVSLDEAREKIQEFFELYPGVQGMIRGAHARAHRDGYITTLFGRRCHIPHIHSYKFGDRKQAERQAANYEVQGSAQDIIKMGMICLHRDDKLRRLGYRQAIQIHDEVVGYAPSETIEEAKPRVEHLMSNSYRLFGFPAMRVSTPVEAGIGNNWSEAKH